MSIASPAQIIVRGRGSLATALILINMLLSIMVATYGLDFHWPDAWRGLIYRSVSVIWLTGLVALFGFNLPAARTGPAPDRVDGLTVSLCLWQLLLTLFFNLPTRWAALVILATTAAVGAVVRRAGPAPALGLVMALGVSLWLGIFITDPFGVAGGDMLPFIVHAGDVFRAGGDPYLADYSAITASPFFYPPLQWLVFLPFRTLGIDVRVLSLLCAGAMLFALEVHARRGHPLIRATLYPILLCPLIPPMIRGGQVWPYWAAMLAFALLVLRERWVLAAIAIAVAISLRQTALVPAVAVFIALIGRLRPITLLQCGLAGAVVLVIASVPFAPSYADLRMMLVDGPARAMAGAHQNGNPENQVAASNLIDWFGYFGFDIKTEIVLAALSAVGTRIAARSGPRAMLTAAGLGYVITISANPYLFRYYYVAGLILWAAGAAGPRHPFGAVSTRRDTFAE